MAPVDTATGVEGSRGFRLRELKGRPVLEWPVRVPERDPRGITTGKDFECWKKARDGRTGVSGNWYSVKTGCMQVCHSLLEARLRSYFDMCPFVVECRTQYPSWDREEYQRYYSAGKRFPKNKVMTIDFMLTLAIPGLPYLTYHGVSAKPRALISGGAVVARHEREASAIWVWGGTHEIMDEFTVPDIEHENYLLLKSWLLWTDIQSRMEHAHALAQAIKRSNARGPLDRTLPMIGKRLGFDRDDSYRLLAVAVFLGYLWLDHRFPLRISEPLCLLQ
ncbi:hypothetical protein NCCP691_19350 [Noviherbaspirillum aridicola]|uniref:TnsA endonuclease-like protein n=2 Tax=Noviherbaspirillum aridicola TaxID=2849687 RepID=A0ABQ4Q4G9_9BURK|nr:hypothetical protein NCCP691_19350 [Noviherbaspirillum aridicola]